MPEPVQILIDGDEISIIEVAVQGPPGPTGPAGKDGTSDLPDPTGKDGYFVGVVSDEYALVAAPGTGTVTQFTSGDLSPLFTTSVANKTTTPALTFTAATHNKNLIFASSATDDGKAGAMRALVAADMPDLSGVYTTPAAVAATYLTISNAASTYLTVSNAASTYLTISNAGSTYQPLDKDLTSLAAADKTDVLYYRSGDGTWSAVTIGSNVSFSGGTLSATGGGGGGDAFTTISVSGQDDVVADSATDTLTLVAGSGITITTDKTNDKITFAVGDLSGTYLTISNAASTYLTIATAASTYLTPAAAAAAFQPLDGDLTSLAGADKTDVLYYRSKADTWAPVAIGDNLTFSSGKLSAVGAPVHVGRTIYVDEEQGDDGTGDPYDASKPYASIAAALADATAGDLIHVRPGDYAVSGPIATNGVNWHFDAGAIVTFDDEDPVTAYGLWDDQGAACSYTVTGAGVFRRTTNNTGETAGITNVQVSHASSKVYIQCLDITITDAAEWLIRCVNQTAGELTIECRDIISTGYRCEGVWWTNGAMRVRGRYCIAGQNAFYSDVDSAPTGEAYLDFNEYRANRGTVIYCDGTNADAAVWLRGEIFRATPMATESITSIYVAGANKLYVEAQKVFGAILLQGSTVAYIRADKVSPTFETDQRLLLHAGGTNYIQINHWDSVGSDQAPITVDSGGELHLIGGTLEGDADSLGISVSGGALFARNFYIDTTANDGTSPLTVSGGTVILDGCSLVAESGEPSITAGSAQTVQSRGTTYLSTAPHGNITLSGLFRIGSNSTVSGSNIVTAAALGTGVLDQLALPADGTDVDAIGARGIPQVSFSAATNVIASHNGKMLYHPASDTNNRTVTIQANGTLALEIGFAFEIYNDSANDVTLAITTDTLVQAGSGTTGSITIPQYGSAYVRKVLSTRWVATVVDA